MTVLVREILETKRGEGLTEIYHILGRDSAEDAAKVMNRHHVGILVVTNGMGKFEKDDVLGVVSSIDDTYKVTANGLSHERIKVNEIMTPIGLVVSVTLETDVVECLDLMLEHNIRHLLVFDGNLLVMVISIKDVARVIRNEYKRLLGQKKKES